MSNNSRCDEDIQDMAPNAIEMDGLFLNSHIYLVHFRYRADIYNSQCLQMSGVDEFCQWGVNSNYRRYINWFSLKLSATLAGVPLNMKRKSNSLQTSDRTNYVYFLSVSFGSSAVSVQDSRITCSHKLGVIYLTEKIAFL